MGTAVSTFAVRIVRFWWDVKRHRSRRQDMANCQKSKAGSGPTLRPPHRKLWPTSLDGGSLAPHDASFRRCSTMSSRPPGIVQQVLVSCTSPVIPAAGRIASLFPSTHSVPFAGGTLGCPMPQTPARTDNDRPRPGRRPERSMDVSPRLSL
jgi:hypothetical protein